MLGYRSEKEEEGERRSEGGWQRRTLPPRYHGSTIRARELNDRVRNGTGCTLTALATNYLHSHFPLLQKWSYRSLYFLNRTTQPNSVRS